MTRRQTEMFGYSVLLFLVFSFLYSPTSVGACSPARIDISNLWESGPTPTYVTSAFVKTKYGVHYSNLTEDYFLLFKSPFKERAYPCPPDPVEYYPSYYIQKPVAFIFIILLVSLLVLFSAIRERLG